MKRICAWCNLNMGEVEPLESDESTHSICETCEKEVNYEIDAIEQGTYENLSWLEHTNCV